MKKNEKKQAAALQYKAGEEDAPKVVAKGTGSIAEQIIELAKENNVPIYEDATLVTLLTKIDVGTAIPEELFPLVAEVLAFVYRMDKKYQKKLKADKEIS